MNYRHAYHAGHFADVVKHIILTTLLSLLSRKEKSMCYIDTHAGEGYYDLTSVFSEKTKEYLLGIEKIIQHNDPPPMVKRYLDAVHQINNRLTHTSFSSLRYYPGSVLLAHEVMRPLDKIVACELQREPYQALKNACLNYKNISVHHLDGFLGLKAFLPPQERRGLVLIDPPYEDPDEFSRIAHALSIALKRWETGVYAIWYPIKQSAQTMHFYQKLKKEFSYPMLSAKLTIYPDIANHLNGCGMIIINPPWQCEEEIKNFLPWVWQALTINQQGHYAVERLK